DVPTAFLAIVLGEEAAYVRVSGNLVANGRAPYALDRAIADKLDAASGTLLALAQGPPAGSRATELARFGLAFARRDCRVIHTALIGPEEFPARLCPLVREKSARAAIDELASAWRAQCDAIEGGDAQWQRVCASVRALR